MTEEIHRPVPGWPEYTCSDRGTVIRVSGACGATPGKTLKWQIMKVTGYAKVSLCRNAKRHEFLVHRLVAMTFIETNIPKGMHVCHYDGDKLNNKVENLRIDTCKGNMEDQIRMEKTPRGEKCGTNVRTAERVLAIRTAAESGMKQAEVARAFGVTPQYVCNLVKRRIWAWL